MIALKPENVVDVLFGNRLRQLLDERNISQAHFADRIGVSRSRMNNYVAQRSEPDYATLIRIANTLDTTIDFLLGKYVDGRPNATVDEEWQALLNQDNPSTYTTFSDPY